MPKSDRPAKNEVPMRGNVVPLRVVPQQASGMPVMSRAAQQTVLALRELLDQALAGELEGLAWVEVRQHRNYSVYVAGECADSPTFTRGVVSVLGDVLGRHIALGDPLPIRG
ncbi:hypothetical protein [Piscinibacter gummiphilus]|uniref:Uncharacterized protein n=1 Tax=Piscinibacter gummiphilus TaxID=946333 RepID=A0ABZ0D6V2_9BURK|nr:hypothetical protein [Piscinibacter gummiphilus]WOB10768.1 hypothetical protein RXV79_12090 [Piscinibacter gummiphilus]